MAVGAGSSPWDFWPYSRDSAEVAAERVTEWLGELREHLRHEAFSGEAATRSSINRGEDRASDHESNIADPAETALEAAQLLARATASSDLYCDATTEQHGHQLLLKLLRAQNELLVDAASAIIANCSGPMGAKPSVRAFSVRDIEIKVG